MLENHEMKFDYFILCVCYCIFNCALNLTRIKTNVYVIKPSIPHLSLN